MHNKEGVIAVAEREQLASRLGFILVSAGCAIGLGNVWRFPYITGRYGGAAFVIVYLIFLAIMGLPIMVCEFAMGRASRRNLAGAMLVLEPPGTKWHIYGYLGVLGNMILMMFYTTVTGWGLAYTYHVAAGHLSMLSPEEVGAFFGSFISNTPKLTMWMALAVVIGFLVCSIGLQAGVERVTKILMSGLFLLLIVLIVRSVTLPGAEKGLAFYLKPDFSKLSWEAVYAAMSQAFFTLSLGIGSMLIFGSYLSRERTLAGESVYVVILDTLVALMAGLVIFPACFAFGVDAGAGPGLIFVTLPNVFNSMMGGRLWGTLFFVFLSFASLTTVIAVFEHLIAFVMDEWKWSRKKASYIGILVMFIASLPCVLGFGPWSGFQPFGEGSVVLDLEDFIVSFNLLPIGSLVFVLFCTSKYGWGWDNFIREANTGIGPKFPEGLRGYMTYVLPVIIAVILIMGYIQFFG
jgi:NSS family neurotransmitter:Na+ symporter